MKASENDCPLLKVLLEKRRIWRKLIQQTDAELECSGRTLLIPRADYLEIVRLLGMSSRLRPTSGRKI